MRKIFTNTFLLAALATFLAVFFGSKAASAEVIDRIVATVNGHIILQSDWDDALRYEALLNGRVASEFTDEDRRAVLDRLIDQELLGEQMKSAYFQHASESEAAARVAEALEGALAAEGLHAEALPSPTTPPMR